MTLQNTLRKKAQKETKVTFTDETKKATTTRITRSQECCDSCVGRNQKERSQKKKRRKITAKPSKFHKKRSKNADQRLENENIKEKGKRNIRDREE